MTPVATEPAAAVSLPWSPELALQHAELDATHQEFVALLGQTELAPDDGLMERLQALFEHTVEHFAMEDSWMQASAFAPVNCHGMQHRVVIQTLEELLRRGREDGDLALVREILPELGKWFAQHRAAGPRGSEPEGHQQLRQRQLLELSARPGRLRGRTLAYLRTAGDSTGSPWPRQPR